MILFLLMFSCTKNLIYFQKSDNLKEKKPFQKLLEEKFGFQDKTKQDLEERKKEEKIVIEDMIAEKVRETLKNIRE